MRFLPFGSLMLPTLSALLCLAAGPALADPAVPAFYQSLPSLNAEGKLGEVVKTEAVPTSIPGAEAWRIAYVSSDVQERKTITTALVVVPTTPAPEGGRPIAAWAHGTTGTAQSCGPSQLLDPAQPLNQYFLVGGNSWTDYGLPAVNELIKEGYVVVATDYQGLGGGGRHQYAVAATNGRDVINSVRAAASMAEAKAGRKALVYGWSQGGGATLAAAGLTDYIAQQGTAADGISFVGFVALAPDDVGAMAPASTFDEPTAQKLMAGLAESFGANVFNFTHFSMFAWGTSAAFNLPLEDLFTAEGARALDTILLNKCMHTAADTVQFAYGADYKTLLKAPMTNAQAWANAFVKGSVSADKPVAPVIIYWGTKDTVVPPVMGEIYRAQKCKLGANVTRVQLAGEQTHFSTPGAAEPLYLPWIKDRFAGKPLPDGCAGG